ncbi:anhydro-N-acetylmuramic acid kinase [Sulfurovum riftiae]|uniref:Anhydro-N-acetylmuramic acid kinase n=1 Tax=Sulfurovum riftiae TaxID=1630136 RepID=A0A151CEX0_9BACT|nr:anhydro-N-acetylmuramic acid kinase [Sulfurovum riftiae]KYJ86019.1 anhydro-N-acetylmuramic acid kinase [Sulfurovum riftiae]
MKKERYIGIMSGTSLDGVDVVLCAIDKSSCDLLASYEHPFPETLKEEILHAITSTVTLKQIGELDHKLGELFAEAVNLLIDKEDIDRKSITAIGSHGQTLWHQPEGEHPFSMQLGDPNIIAARTGLKVVADFRRKDMALGGSGAPFAPAFHRFLLGKNDVPLCVGNIGGIANITLLGEELIGYDTGPGNMLMDMWIKKHKSVGYDKDGRWAREGKIVYPLLESMMEDAYFGMAHPKSTGREKFNEKWLEDALRGTSTGSVNTQGTVAEPVEAEDVQRTLLELTALSLSNEVLKFNPDMLLLCGGGAKNGFLVERIAALMPNVQVGVMEQADSLEAMMMAWLAYKRLHNEHVDLKEVTGAFQNSILGGVYL